MIHTYKVRPFSHGVDILVPEEYDRIGIAMSGGLDSTLLAYFLRQWLDWRKVTVYTVDQKNSVQTVKNLFRTLGIRYSEHQIIPDPKNENGALSPVFLDICENVDYFYTGITKNPPWADAIPDGQKPHRFNKIQYQNMFMPFGASDKQSIVEIYKEYNLHDLAKLTHTCTERPHVEGGLSCGVCFACRERIWAYKEANVVDTVQYE